MTIERIEEVRDKYLYICDNVAAKYNLDEDGKQDLVLYYLELCLTWFARVPLGSTVASTVGLNAFCAAGSVRQPGSAALRNASSTMTLFRRRRTRFGLRAYLKKSSNSCLN